MPLIEKIMLRKRFLIETLFDILKIHMNFLTPDIDLPQMPVLIFSLALLPINSKKTSLLCTFIR